MKTIILPAALLILVLCSCSKDSNSNCTEATLIDNCIDPNQIDTTALCTYEYKPVCGCDGKTYSNACEAEHSGVTSYTDGACCD